MIQSTLNLEKELSNARYDLILGVDEAGRGPLAGPVVAGAVMLKNCNFESLDLLAETKLVRDSKKLSPKQRERVFDFIHEHFYVGVGICDHKTIDRINILEASFLAMKKAVADLIRSKPKVKNQESKVSERIIILVDGNKIIPNFSYEQKAVVGGDRLVKSISAASIIAKVTRDQMMLESHEKYPQYGFDKHKGYGTKFHIEMIEKYGPSEIHRRSFEPVKTLAKNRY